MRDVLVIPGISGVGRSLGCVSTRGSCLAMARRTEATATGGADSTSRCCSTTYDGIAKVASRLPRHESGWTIREIESSLQPFGELLLRGRLVRENAAPHCVRWVRRFLTRKASDEPLADQVRRFCEDLERKGRVQEWQVRQAAQALRMFFVNFLKRTDWHRRPASAVVDEHGGTNPLATLEELRRRITSRHYSSRTERTYADWVRRFFAYLAERQNAPHPPVDSDAVRECLTHLARAAPGVGQQSESGAVRHSVPLPGGPGCGGGGPILRGGAKRRSRLPVVLSIPETAALLGGLRGRTWLMAALIYGGGLRVSECKGDKDRSTLLAQVGRDKLRVQLRGDYSSGSPPHAPAISQAPPSSWRQ